MTLQLPGNYVRKDVDRYKFNIYLKLMIMYNNLAGAFFTCNPNDGISNKVVLSVRASIIN